MSQEKDKIFFRNYSIVIGILAVFLIVCYILAQMVGVDEEKAMKDREALVAKQTEAVGSVSVEGVDETPVAENTSSGAVDGKAVYEGLCIACHSVPGIGAPVVGNTDEWEARIAKGMDTLYNNAINGYTGPEGYMMPAKGGGNLSDEEVKAAVDYMVTESGGSAGGGDGEASASAGKSGEEVYNSMCVACHSVPGIGAPVVGKAEDWTDRIAQGTDVLYDHAINGFTGPGGFMMPARGGGQFTDDEVIAAVDYMLEKSQ